MALFKLCGRGHINPPHAIMCEECLEDLSRVTPSEIEADDDLSIEPVSVELDEIDLEEATLLPRTPPTFQPDDEELLIVYPDDKLRFQTEDGQVFSAGSGDIVGRAQTGSEILQNYPTVSRFHFRLIHRDGGWFIGNLSDNGTWVNGKETVGGEETPIAPGDELSLSSKCRLTISP